MKKKIFIVLVMISLFIITGCSKKEEKKDENLLSGKYYVTMSIKDYGNVVLELDADNAPITVTNFINLVKDKYYDGLTFNRVIDGFMIEGGESEKEASTIKGEFKKNGVKNNLSHTKGTISMYRNDDDYDSASAKFFIMLGDYPELDSEYASFGKVIEGMNVIDKISKIEIIPDTNGIIDIDKQPVIESMVIIDKDGE